MPYVLIHGNVKDFDHWKTVFTDAASIRTAGGSKGGYVFQTADDPNELIVMLEFDDLQKARDLYSSPAMRETMERAGVVGQPHMHFLELAERPSA